MSRTTKSQLSVEFMIVIFFASMIFAFSLYVYFQQSLNVDSQKELFQAKEIVQKYVLHANLAYLDSSTCGETFYVPTLINSKPYTLIYVSDLHILSINWSKSYYSFPILNSDISINTTVHNSHYVNCSGGIFIE